MKNIKILLTGGTGMVGQAVVRNIPKNVSIVSIGSGMFDLRDANKTKRMFRIHRPDKVIHLAARVGGVKANMNNMADFFNDNILINTNVLMAAHEYGVQNVVSMLSTCIYPDKQYIKYPLTENQLHLGPPHESNFGYAYSKRMLEVQAKAYRIQYGRNYTSAIPNNIYGPCFSGETEVLTLRGITNIKNVKLGEQIYTLNPNTFEVEIATVDKKTFFYSGEEYTFKSKAVDFCVTPEHKMFYKTSTGYVKKPASNFKKKCGKKYGQITFAHHSPVESKEDVLSKISLDNYVDKNHSKLSETRNGITYIRDHEHSKSKFFPIQ